MSEDALGYIAEELEKIGIPYSFMAWESYPVPNPYFIGEYVETSPVNEDGLMETSFILTGTTRGDWLTLERAKNKIMQRFSPISGATVILANGAGLAVFYSDSFPVQTEDEEFKRIQINLQIKEWRVE